MSYSKQSKLVDSLLVPVLSGIIAGSSFYLLGETGSLPIAGMLINGPLALGSISVASSLVGNSLGVYVLPKIPMNMRFANLERMLVVPVLTGLSSTALIGFTVPTADKQSLMKVFAIGAGSEMAGGYASEMIKPLINKK